MSATSPDPLSPEADIAADRRRRWWIVSAAILLPVTMMVIGSLGEPSWSLVVLALALPACWLVGQRHHGHTREGTDERAQHLHRRSTAFSWQVMAALLVAAVIWMDLRHGIRAAEPYLVLGTALLASYLVPRLWWQWRDH